MPDLKRTPLYDLHVSLGAKMVPFAGYDMPVQYSAGVMAEHLHTRAEAGLFDVSHMGPMWIEGPDPASALEAMMPQSIIGLKGGRQRYGFLTNDTGGIIDDLMVAKIDAGRLHLVVNAGNKDQVIAHIRSHCPGHVVEPFANTALLALQGPAAEAVLAEIVPGCQDMKFMDYRRFESAFGALDIARSGYTGEDGFEIAVAADKAADLATRLLENDAVLPVGLGARDSLRLEAGLCLYGQDMDEEVSPVEASLTWAIQRVRRTGGAREGGFHGAAIILDQLKNGPGRHRVGLLPEGRAPMRQGVPLFQQAEGGSQIGHVTSGGFGPTVGAPVAMGLVADGLHSPGTPLFGEVRGKRLPVQVAPLPFTAANFKR